MSFNLFKGSTALLTLAGLASAQSRTDEASAAQSTNAVQECTPYTYAPVAAFTADFPTIWQIATILPADSQAMGLFNSLNSSIPNYPPKGTPTGDFSSVTPTYPPSDPDCWWSYSKCLTPKIDNLPHDIASVVEPNVWGLTYDDGPNCSHNAFYDFLETNNQKATLFYIGSNVFDWPLEAQRGLADGHEICAHTWSHRYMTALTNEQAFAELYYSKKAIKDVLGVTPQCWRPPYGDVDDRIRYIANALGMETIIWVEDTFDYEFATIGIPAVDANYQAIITKGQNGTYATDGPIVLSHELTNETMSEAVKWYPQIKQAFKHIVPVAVANNNTQPYVEKDIVYPNFAQYIAGTTTVSLVAPTATDAPISLPFSSGQAGSVTGTSFYSTGATNPGAAKATGKSGASSVAAPRLGELAFAGVIAAGVAGGFGWVAAVL